MADRYLLESGSPDGYQLEDASGVLILESQEAAPKVGVALPESPRAVPRTVAVQAQSWMRSVLLPLIHDTTRIFRTPLFATRFVPRFVQQPTFAANLLLTTLAVVAPFTPANATQLDPTPRVSSHAAVLPAAPARFDLDTLAQNPFSQADWQNPRGPKPVTPGIERGLDIDTLALNPFVPPFENPGPRLRWTPQHDAPNLLSALLEVPAGPAPFTQGAWPNPVLRIKGVIPLHHRYAGEPVAAPEAAPFTQTDWANPVRALRIPQADSQPVFDRSVVAAQDPFVQHDWPNPRGPKPVTPGLAQGLDLDTLALNPFIPTVENPLPRRPATLQPDNIRNLFGSTLAPGAPPEPPFYQTDWPNPVLRIRAVVPLHHRYAGEPVAAPAQNPFAQRDWPNPVRALRIPQVDIQPVFTLSVVATPLPFSQMDWPNPRGHKGVYRHQTAARSYEVMPFAQYEWPNPLPRPRYREIGVQSSIPYAEFIIVPPTPHNVSDWPNPIRRVLPTEWGPTAQMYYQAFITTPTVIPISVADSFSIGLTETSAVSSYVGASDFIAIPVTESVFLYIQLSVLDSLTLGMSDVSALAEVLRVTDTVLIGILEDAAQQMASERAYWEGFVPTEYGKVYQDSWQMGERPNPDKLRW